MPPSRHSTSTRGAHKDSNLLAVGDSYSLGEYTFTLQVVTSEGEKVIQAHCSGPEGNAAKGITVSSSTQVKGWTVEANDTSADVYVVVDRRETTDKTFTNSWGTVTVTGCTTDLEGHEWMGYDGSVPRATRNYGEFMLISQYPQTFRSSPGIGASGHSGDLYWWNIAYGLRPNSGAPFFPVFLDDQICHDLWQGGEGSESGEKTVLVARFAIKLEEAGGYPGGGGDWDEEGDYDSEHYPDPDERDPTYTLYLNVTGALSGRHNDPLHDTSYSYIPANKATVKSYGCGGDGGHGGGGGGGASTVVVRKFATNRADSKDITVTVKRHGYGSGGGKGGKGGDGIILIYY